MNCGRCGGNIEPLSSALRWVDSGKRKDGKVVMMAVCEDCYKEIEKERFRGHPSDDCHTYD